MENANVVDKLLEIDRQARRTIDDAQQYYDGIVAEIEVQKKRLAEEYEAKAQAHLETVRSVEESVRQEAQDEVRERFGGIGERLDAAYRENSCEWEQALFGRVLGGPCPEAE